ACRDAFPRAVALPLWVLAEIAICATDLAEVIGTAIGLNLLFKIPLEIGVIITALDVFLILAMQRLGFRWIESFVVALLGVIAACFAVQIALAHPDCRKVILGFAPTTEIVRNPEMLSLALGQAHAFLAPLLGAAIAPTLFGIALLCCGMNSTVTATLSGQIVMEGFIDIRLPAWARRLTTRALAIVPAAMVTIWYGEAGTA